MKYIPTSPTNQIVILIFFLPFMIFFSSTSDLKKEGDFGGKCRETFIFNKKYTIF